MRQPSDERIARLRAASLRHKAFAAQMRSVTRQLSALRYRRYYEAWARLHRN